MNIMPFLVDWDEIVQRKAAGTLEAGLNEAMEDDVPWFQSLDVIPENDVLFTSTAEAYERLRPELPDDLREQSDAFFNHLFTFQDYCQDVDLSSCGEWGEVFLLTFSPESVARYKAAGDVLDFEQLREAFLSATDPDTRAAFAEWMEIEPDESFENGFLPYLQSWRDGFELAANAGKGIMIKWA